MAHHRRVVLPAEAEILFAFIFVVIWRDMGNENCYIRKENDLDTRTGDQKKIRVLMEETQSNTGTATLPLLRTNFNLLIQPAVNAGAKLKLVVFK